MNKEAIQKKIDYIRDYTESWLNTKLKKILFVSALVAALLVAAYICAVFDIGLEEWTVSPGQMLKLYWTTKASFPWGVFFVLALCILFVAVLLIWKNGYPMDGRNFKLSKTDTYGSAREISQRELRQVTEVTHQDATLGTILGQLDPTGKEVIASKAGAMPNDNMLVFGPPGSGKSTSYVLTYITQAILRRHSICVSDTKGEVYAKTAELARRHGYKVRRLDLKDPEHSDGWNVLKELRHNDVRALIFAQTVMANSGNERDNFAAPQESLLKSCCLFQERMPGLPDSMRTFYQAFALLLQGAETLDTTMTAAFSEHPVEMGVVADSYATFLQGSTNLRGNIITGLANRLQVLASPPVREMTSTDDINFEDMGKEPTILYISMSDQHQTMSFLASLAFSFAFLDLVELADKSPGQRLPIPVHMLMEEFGNLGRIPNIDKYLSTARSRGISINLVVQSLAQLIGIYEESMTDTILADCATWMCLGCNDKSTAELLEWRSGESTIEVQTTQHDAMEPHFRLAHRHSAGDGRRAFYTSNDIMKIRARKEAFIVWQQMDSIKVRAFPIFQHREFKAGHMPEISANSLIPLKNAEARAKFREWEDARIKSFREWMAAGGNPLKDYTGFPPAVKSFQMNNQPLPDITPIHTLERMAIAWSEHREYNPADDPDNPTNQATEDMWDLSDLELEDAEPMPEAETVKPAPVDTVKTAPVETAPPAPENRDKPTGTTAAPKKETQPKPQVPPKPKVTTPTKEAATYAEAWEDAQRAEEEMVADWPAQDTEPEDEVPVDVALPEDESDDEEIRSDVPISMGTFETTPTPAAPQEEQASQKNQPQPHATTPVQSGFTSSTGSSYANRRNANSVDDIFGNIAESIQIPAQSVSEKIAEEKKQVVTQMDKLTGKKRQSLSAMKNKQQPKGGEEK